MPDGKPTRSASAEPDWTTGPAKWIAVVILGIASILGTAWSISSWRGAPAGTRAASHAQRAQAAGSDRAGEGAVDPASASAAESARRISSPVAPASGETTTIININTATQGRLELLPGIGPALAARIVAYRDEHGPFASVDELDRVKGIGSRTLERIRPMVKVAD